MFEIMNALFLGVTLVADIGLYADKDTKLPAQGSAVKVSFHREFWRDDGKCSFTGMMAPFARTWPLERDNGDGTSTVLPPEPGKVAGYGIVINKRTCPDGTVTPMMHIDARNIVKTLFNADQMNYKYKITAQAASGFKADDVRAAWLPQVMALIEERAATNQDAAEFVAFNKERARLAPQPESK